LRWHIDVTGGLVRANWAAIRTVARVLLERTEVPEPDVVSMIENADPQATRWNRRCSNKLLRFISFWFAAQSQDRNSVEADT
jgi:hypothetical protein